MKRRILVAGIGNIFFGDDGFGVEVMRCLKAGRGLPDGVDIADIGIRGIHLLYQLMDGCGLLVLVDTATRGQPPGTVTVLEAELPQREAGEISLLDAHGLAPDELLAAVAGLGASPDRTMLVLCEPADMDPGIGLSPEVHAAVPAAVLAVAQIIARETDPGPVQPVLSGLGSPRSTGPTFTERT
jgi:hydrogenase maturation protease